VDAVLIWLDPSLGGHGMAECQDRRSRGMFSKSGATHFLWLRLHQVLACA